MTNYPPLKLHPQNPHYFLFRGKPTILITSAEHYGSVLNLDFDYRAYLDVLAKYGMNATRIYAGAYVEPEEYFIHDNVLGPKPGRLCLPWARSDKPGYPLGGNIFDLDRWDAIYFERLHDFVRRAGERGVVVEVCMFNAAYPDTWHSMPLYHTNNLQGVADCEANDVQTLRVPELVRRHVDYVRKITQEVNEYDNIILEIVDEPGLKGTTPEDYVPWISRLMDVIVETEKALPQQHLIAQQVCGTIGGLGDFSSDRRLSVIVGQYPGPTDGKQMGGMQLLDADYGYGKPIELNETAFYPIWYVGDKLAASRSEAWEFVVGGGGSFNHLNGLYSIFNATAAGTEIDAVLTQLVRLREFMHSFDFLRMQRDPALLAGPLPEGALGRGMSEPGKQYAFYIHHSKEEKVKYVAVPGSYTETLPLRIAAGAYRVECIDPESGKVIRTEKVVHKGGDYFLQTPVYSYDLALRIVREG